MHANACRMMVLSVIAAMAAGASARPAPAAGAVVLDAKSLWRCRFIKGTDIARRKSGELEHVIASPAWKFVNVKIDGKRVRRRKLVQAPRVRRPMEGKPIFGKTSRRNTRLLAYILGQRPRPRFLSRRYTGSTFRSRNKSLFY